MQKAPAKLYNHEPGLYQQLTVKVAGREPQRFKPWEAEVRSMGHIITETWLLQGKMVGSPKGQEWTTQPMSLWSRTPKHFPTQGVLPATDGASWCWWPWCSGLFWQAVGCALHSPCSSTLGQHACLYPTPTYMFLVSYLRNNLLSVHLVWWSRRRVTTGSWRQTQDVNEVHKSLLASAISVTPAPNTETCMKHAWYLWRQVRMHPRMYMLSSLHSLLCTTKGCYCSLETERFFPTVMAPM